MKIPRDVGAQDLIKYLRSYDYIITRQTGSHIRLTTNTGGQHHITIPNHAPLKIGTLSAILNDVANHLRITKEDLIKEIFG